MADRRQGADSVDDVVVGLGATGLSLARHLRRRGCPFAVTDSRAEPPGRLEMEALAPEARVVTGALDPVLILGARRLYLSPGVSLDEPLIRQARSAGVQILGDIELFARNVNAPVLAVTGSNGKSTVTTLVGEMAGAALGPVPVGGNLGTPALDLLQEPPPALYVLELSSFQLETTSSLNAAAATVLNLSEDHMDRYRSMDEYAAAKRRIFRGNGALILNADDPRVAAMAEPGRPCMYFTLGSPAGEGFGVLRDADGDWLARGGERLLPAAALKIQGAHNRANALAALALGTAVGLDQSAMLQVLRRFPGLPHRCQWVARVADVDFYNDSKGTNVGATCTAIRGLAEHRRLVLIAGGDGKGADFSPLADACAGRVRAVVLMGRDGPRIAAVLAGRLPVIQSRDMDEAVRRAAEAAAAGDVVLLSPACASLDMYRSYVERGERFVAAVEALAR